MRSYAFLFWAYTAIWLMLAAYLAWLGVRLGRVGRRLDGLERRLERERAGDQRSSSS